jgi:hypothetical protein
MYAGAIFSIIVISIFFIGIFLTEYLIPKIRFKKCKVGDVYVRIIKTDDNPFESKYRTKDYFKILDIQNGFIKYKTWYEYSTHNTPGHTGSKNGFDFFKYWVTLNYKKED